MRRIAAPVAFLAAMLLSMVPVSGQTVSDLTVRIINPAGPITTCPYTINFLAIITMNWPASTPVQSRAIQYKWINSSGIDEPTQTADFFALQIPLQSVAIKNSWKVNAGSYWEALQISFPLNQTSPQRFYVVTCPTPGALSLPATITGPILSPPVLRP
jgi:hypothetical protein